MATIKKIKKAQSGETIRGSRPGLGEFKTVKERTTAGGIAEPYNYTRTSVDTTGYAKGKPTYDVKTQTGEGDKTGSSVKSNTSKQISRKEVSSTLESLKKKNGGKLLKRKDGSKSPRGLWDNIRAAKGSGKKPTPQMLKQEKKIKLQSKKK